MVEPALTDTVADPPVRPAADQTRRPADDDEVLVDQLAYDYDGTFDRAAIGRVVADVRAALTANATIDTYLPVLIARQTRQRLSAAAVAAGRPANPVPELLFVCVHNAGRSQLAAAIATHLTGGRVHARSAGSAPADEINPVVVQVLAERGITLTDPQPKQLTHDVVHASDVIITMGCGDACPFYPGKRYLDWQVPDPHNQPVEVVREIRDLIQARVTDLLRDLNL